MTSRAASKVLTSDSDELLGGRYRVRQLIARGGSASVYRARDEFLGRDVAVKVFDSSTSAEKDFSAQEEEMGTLARLVHPSLVTLLDASIDRSHPAEPRIYFVMELVEGVDLYRRLTCGTLAPRLVAQIGRDIAEGLEYVHRRGVVHRDIKPANILLADYADDETRTRAKLTDFGIALSGDTGELSGSSIVVTGTVAYLSPEQVKGERIGPPSDIYSLGLVLLECFTGELAFPGTPQESALLRLHRGPAIPADLPEQWRELLAGMTASDPAERPAIYDLVSALNELTLAESGRHKVVDAAAVLAEEAARMAAVHRYDLLDTPPDAVFDRITALAARVFAVPMAIMSVVDHDRIWFASHHGLEADQVPRDPGLCASAILNDSPWIIEEARTDPRTRGNPLVAGDFALQFYAGVPLRTPDGYNLGTIAVLGRSPRRITVEEVATLQDLAALVIHELEMRLKVREMVPVSVLQKTEALELSGRSDGVGPASGSGIALVS